MPLLCRVCASVRLIQRYRLLVTFVAPVIALAVIAWVLWHSPRSTAYDLGGWGLNVLAFGGVGALAAMLWLGQKTALKQQWFARARTPLVQWLVKVLLGNDINQQDNDAYVQVFVEFISAVITVWFFFLVLDFSSNWSSMSYQGWSGIRSVAWAIWLAVILVVGHALGVALVMIDKEIGK